MATMKRKHINPRTLPNWSGMFSQVVVTEKNGLRFIHISGQVGVGPDKNIIGRNNLQEQTTQALKNLKSALTAAGANITDLVKITIYVLDYQYKQASVIREALRAVFPQGRLPALTLIGVAALAGAEFLIEIDAEAITDLCGPTQSGIRY